ncbi:hypothetical protein [Mesorhizobium waimense]|nr:hypothetical protein [Mesorhizobium waimense]
MIFGDEPVEIVRLDADLLALEFPARSFPLDPGNTGAAEQLGTEIREALGARLVAPDLPRQAAPVKMTIERRSSLASPTAPQAHSAQSGQISTLGKHAAPGLDLIRAPHWSSEVSSLVVWSPC